DDARDRPKDASLGAGRPDPGGGDLLEKAAVAGVPAREHGQELAGGGDGGAVDEGDVGQDGGVVGEELGGEVVGAVDEETVVAAEGRGVGGVEAGGVRDDGDVGVAGTEGRGEGVELRGADGGDGVKE